MTIPPLNSWFCILSHLHGKQSKSAFITARTLLGFPDLTSTVKHFTLSRRVGLTANLWHFRHRGKRVREGDQYSTEPLLLCFIPGGLIRWMFKDEPVTIGDQMGLTRGWKCELCLLNRCRRDEDGWVKVSGDRLRRCPKDDCNGY